MQLLNPDYVGSLPRSKFDQMEYSNVFKDIRLRYYTIAWSLLVHALFLGGRSRPNLSNAQESQSLDISRLLTIAALQLIFYAAVLLRSKWVICCREELGVKLG